MPQFVLVFTRLGRTKTPATFTLLDFISLGGGGGGGGVVFFHSLIHSGSRLLKEYKNSLFDDWPPRMIL